MHEMLLKGTIDTLHMTVLSTILAYVAGLPLGVVLVLTRKNGIKPKVVLHTVLESIVNIWRSIPFFILMIALIPLTRAIVGKGYGVNAVSISLFIGATPFVARMVEQSLLEIEEGVVEACIVMGATTPQLIEVLLRESIPSLVRGVSITFIMLIGYSAMAGTVGGGGLGDIAVRYGAYRYEYQVMMVTLVIIVAIVMICQGLFQMLVKKIDKKVK